jgi:hypothetical protein
MIARPDPRSTASPKRILFATIGSSSLHSFGRRVEAKRSLGIHRLDRVLSCQDRRPRPEVPRHAAQLVSTDQDLIRQCEDLRSGPEILFRKLILPHLGRTPTVLAAGDAPIVFTLRAGQPMLFVPYGWDQPDNAARVERLGAGLCLTRQAYSADTATGANRRLLLEPHFRRGQGMRNVPTARG